MIFFYTVIALLLGLGHYVIVSLSIVVDPYANRDISLSMFSFIGTMLGMTLFLFASLHQMKCNIILATLKAQKNSGGYGIPRGDWFEWTWNPLYGAEILIYISFVLLTQAYHVQLILMTIWVAVNQSISAHRSYKWYQSTFPKNVVDQLPKRAILIPRLW
jgi:3-oxo-5-alpha-steroid 4-dehydrogenase 3